MIGRRYSPGLVTDAVLIVIVTVAPVAVGWTKLLSNVTTKPSLSSQRMGAVWGPKHTEENHYLRVYMGILRQKLEPNPTRPRYLLTEPGGGYRLAVE